MNYGALTIRDFSQGPRMPIIPNAWSAPALSKYTFPHIYLPDKMQLIAQESHRDTFTRFDLKTNVIGVDPSLRRTGRNNAVFDSKGTTLFICGGNSKRSTINEVFRF